jgi:hypothetical protein
MTGMDDLIRTVEAKFIRDEIPEFRPGDIICIYEKLTEGAHERLHPFEGVVLKISGTGANKTVTVRKAERGTGRLGLAPLWAWENRERSSLGLPDCSPFGAGIAFRSASAKLGDPGFARRRG